MKSVPVHGPIYGYEAVECSVTSFNQDVPRQVSHAVFVRLGRTAAGHKGACDEVSGAGEYVAWARSLQLGQLAKKNRG